MAGGGSAGRRLSGPAGPGDAAPSGRQPGDVSWSVMASGDADAAGRDPASSAAVRLRPGLDETGDLWRQTRKWPDGATAAKRPGRGNSGTIRAGRVYVRSGKGDGRN